MSDIIDLSARYETRELEVGINRQRELTKVTGELARAQDIQARSAERAAESDKRSAEASAKFADSQAARLLAQRSSTEETKKGVEAAEKFVNSIKEQADAIGKTKTQILENTAAQMKLTDAQKKSVDESLRAIRAHEQQHDRMQKLVAVTRVGVAVFAAIAAAMAVKTAQAVGSAAAMATLSEKTGIAIKDLNALKLAADLSDTNINTVARTVSYLPRSIAEARQSPQSESGRAFAFLGIDPNTLKSKEEALNKVAEAISRVDSNLGKTQAAQAIFKRGAEEILPFLNTWATQQNEIVNIANRFNPVTEESAKKAKELQDQLVILNYQGQELFRLIAQELVPALVKLLGAFIDIKNAGIGTMEGIGAVIEHKARSVMGIQNAYDNPIEVSTEAQKNIAEVAAYRKRYEEDQKRGGITGFISRLVRPHYDTNVKETRARGDLALANAVLKQRGSNEPKDNMDLWGVSPFAKNQRITGTMSLREAGGGSHRNPEQEYQRALAQFEKIQADAQIQETKKRADREIAILKEKNSIMLLSDRELYEREDVIRRDAYDKERSILEQRRDDAELFYKKQKNHTKDQVEADKLRFDAQKKLIELDAEYAHSIEMNSLKRQQKMEQERKQLASFGIELKRLMGDDYGAAIDGINAKYDELIRRAQVLSAEERKIAVAKYEQGREIEKQLAAISDMSRKTDLRQSVISTGANLSRTQIDEKKATGEFSDIDQMRAYEQLNREHLNMLKDIHAQTLSNAEAYEGMGRGYEATAERIKAANIEAEMKRLASSVDLVADKIRSTFEDAFSHGFEEILNGTKSFKDAFKEVLNSIFQEINRMVAKELSQQLMKALKGDSNDGGLFKTIADFLFPNKTGKSDLPKTVNGIAGPATTEVAMQTLSSSALEASIALRELAASAGFSSTSGKGGGGLGGLFSMFGGGQATNWSYAADAASAGGVVDAVIASGIMATGGEIYGPSHGAGGVPIEAEGGEYIINKRQTQKWLPVLEAINMGHGKDAAKLLLREPIPKFASGGMVEPKDEQHIKKFADGGEVESKITIVKKFADGGIVEPKDEILVKKFADGGCVDEKKIKKFADGGLIDDQLIQKFAGGGAVNPIDEIIVKKFADGGCVDVKEKNIKKYADGGMVNPAIEKIKKFAFGGMVEPRDEIIFKKFADGGIVEPRDEIIVKKFADGGIVDKKFKSIAKYADGGIVTFGIDGAITKRYADGGLVTADTSRNVFSERAKSQSAFAATTQMTMPILGGDSVAKSTIINNISFVIPAPAEKKTQEQLALIVSKNLASNQRRLG